MVCFPPSPTLLLENYQPWLDLKVPSKVDASVAEVGEEERGGGGWSIFFSDYSSWTPPLFTSSLSSCRCLS